MSEKLIRQKTVTTTIYAATTWYILYRLRDQYRQDRDLFSAGERARLRFLRWLVRTRRLVP